MVTRCHECQKKIPLVNEVACKCLCGKVRKVEHFTARFNVVKPSQVFCLTHRLPEKHACTFAFTFDVKLEACIAPKINKLTS